MSRSTHVVTFSLSQAGSFQKPAGSYRYCYVADMPLTAQGQILIGFDDHAPDMPFYRGDGWQVCDGDALFEKVTILTPALTGTLTLIFSQADIVPKVSGGASGAADTRRLMEGWWLPHGSGAIGGALVLGGIGSNDGAFFDAATKSGTGNNPQLNVRGLRCAQCLPSNTPGTSGVHHYIAWPWQRLRDERPLGAGGARLFSPVGDRVVSFNFEALLRLDAVSSGKGVVCGMQFVQGNGTLANLSTGVAGFGIVNDGVVGAASWWAFVVRGIDGGPLAQQNLPKPTGFDVTDWCKFRIEVADADPLLGRDGRVNIYQNDQPALSFGDNDMPAFPPSWNGGIGNRTGFDVILNDGNPQADALCFARAHYWVDSILAGTP